MTSSIFGISIEIFLKGFQRSYMFEIIEIGIKKFTKNSIVSII